MTTTNSARVFKNPILESMTKSNPTLTIGFYTLMICFFVYLNFRLTPNTTSITFLIYGSGLLLWTLMEYILHRFVFHIDEYLPALKRFHFIIHGIHHAEPRDRERLFMPPVPGTIIAATLLGFFYLFLERNAFAMMGGITNGYLMYSYIHYSVHTKPVFHPLRRLWKHHALHHYKYQDCAFGVSSPLWDRVFGTMPPSKS